MQSAGPYDPLGACALPLLVSKMSIAALRAEVRKANTAYRNGEPTMSDQAYDQLLQQLRDKAPYAPELDDEATVLLSLDNQPFEYWYSTLPVDTTMVVQPNQAGGWTLQVQAGAGIVADSKPEAEYQETLNKARGMLTALACLEGSGS